MYNLIAFITFWLIVNGLAVYVGHLIGKWMKTVGKRREPIGEERKDCIYYKSCDSHSFRKVCKYCNSYKKI